MISLNGWMALYPKAPPQIVWRQGNEYKQFGRPKGFVGEWVEVDHRRRKARLLPGLNPSEVKVREMPIGAGQSGRSLARKLWATAYTQWRAFVIENWKDNV